MTAPSRARDFLEGAEGRKLQITENQANYVPTFFDVVKPWFRRLWLFALRKFSILYNACPEKYRRSPKKQLHNAPVLRVNRLIVLP